MSDPLNAEGRVGELAEDFLDRHRRGLRPSVDAYVAEYPDLADEIRRLFPALLMMEELKPASGDATGSFNGTAVVVRGARLERLGDFRILREVGRGGMGVVYEAEQESLGRRVALKVLTAHHLPDPAHLRRFEREARAAARLHHTNIVPVFGVGQQEGLHYYVMQFIQGLGLDEVISELKRLRSAAPGDGAATPPILPEGPDAAPTAAGLARSLISEQFAPAPQPGDDPSTTAPLPDGPGEPAIPLRVAAPDPSSQVVLGPAGLSSVSSPGTRYGRSVARVGLQVARALEYAHAQGIFHRDVKPSNLLLDVQGTTWVADFGLAKAVEGEDLTHTGDIVGTIRYMAPERFRGKCDARADIYALGLTLYELLALRPAFEETDRQALIQQVMEQEPPRLRRLNPAVPRDLDTVVHKAIDKDPAGRYPTAAALAEDLELYLDGRPIRARTTSALERCWKWAKRRPAVASLLAGLVVAVLTGLVAVTWQWRAAVAARDESRRTLKMANEAVNTYFTQVSEEQLLNQPGMQPLRRKLLERAIPYYKAFAVQKSDDPALRLDLANAYLRWGRIAGELGSKEEAETAFQAAVAPFEGHLQSEPANVEARTGLAKAHYGIGRLRVFAGQPESGRRELEQSIECFKAVLSSRPHDVDCRRALGECYSDMAGSWQLYGDVKASIAWIQKTLEIRTAVLKDAPSDTSTRLDLGKTLNNLSVVYRDDGRVTESEQAARRAVGVMESLVKEVPSQLDFHWILAMSRGNLGMTQWRKGTIHAAELTRRETRLACEKLVRDNPSVPWYRDPLAAANLYLGNVHAAQGRTFPAKRLLEEGLAHAQELLRLDPNFTDGYELLAGCYSALGLLDTEHGQTNSALQLLEKALEIGTHIPGGYSSGDLQSILFETRLALLLDVRADRSTAAEKIAEVRRLVEERRGKAENDPENLIAASEAVSGYLALATRDLASGTPAAALDPLDKASTVLDAARRTSPELLVLRSLAVRLEATRGDALARIGKTQEALAAAKRAVNVAEPLAREDSAYLYDLACAYALQARLDASHSDAPAKAIEALRGTVKNGFDNVSKLEADARLAPLRPRADFRDLIQLVKKTATPVGRSASANSQR